MLGFWRNERGGVAIAFALSAIPMIGVAGLAVDYMRASEVRSALQVEADAAALASAASQEPLGQRGMDDALRNGDDRQIR